MKKPYSTALVLFGFVIWCSFTISTSFADYIHQEGYCVMHGHCGSKSFFGKELNCPYNKPAIEVNYFILLCYRTNIYFKMIYLNFILFLLLINPSSAR
jgi:hypothetical protein